MSESAAFFRFEGTLSPRPTLATAAFLAGNSQGFSERFARLGSVALAAPFVFGGPLRDPTTGSRMAWMGLRDISEDRLIILGEDYAHDYLIPSLRPVGLELIAHARGEGHRVVVVSDNLDVVMRPVCEHLGVADFACNSMELRKGRATGRLNDPILGGHVAGHWARKYADDHAIDLRRSLGYGAHGDDGMLLGAIGKPCAVHPDRDLRRMARDLDWPVVES
jgi:phosphoserine phosphatase